MNQSKEIQMIQDSNNSAAEKKETEIKNSTELSLIKQFHIAFPYLYSFMTFTFFYLGLTVGVNMLTSWVIQLGGFPWVEENGNNISITTINLEGLKFVGGFFIFKVVVQKQLLPYLKL